MKKLFCLSFSLLCAMQLLAQRGVNTPFVGTGVPTVSFSALSSNAIYDMIISYGGGGGGGNANALTNNQTTATTFSNAVTVRGPVTAGTNYTERVENTNTSTLTLSGGNVELTLASGAATLNSPYSFVGAFTGNGSGLTNLSTTALLGWSTNIAGAGMVSNSMPVIQINGVLYVPGTLLAGNLASAMNPGTTTIYNIRTDTGTAAGTFIEGSIGLNGTRALGIGGYVNDVGNVSNMTVTAYGGFVVKSNAFLTPPTLAEGDNWYFSSNGIPHVRYYLGGAATTVRLVP